MAQNYTKIDHLLKKQKSFVGSTNKEVEPLIKKESRQEVQEVVEYEPSKEVGEFIKVHPETIKLPPDLKDIGLESHPATPKFTNYQNVKLPISDDKVISGLRQPINSSWRWLATLAAYLLKRAHLSLKIIGGKVVRVLSS